MSAQLTAAQTGTKTHCRSHRLTPPLLSLPVPPLCQLPVPELQQRIAASEGVPVSRQRLIYQGKVLKPDQTLRSYNIEDGDAAPPHRQSRGCACLPRRPAATQRLPLRRAAGAAPAGSGVGLSFGPMAADDRLAGGFQGGQMLMANLNLPNNGQMPDFNQLVSSVLNSIGALNAQQPQQQQQQTPASLQPTATASPTPSPPPLQPTPAALAPQPATILSPQALSTVCLRRSQRRLLRSLHCLCHSLQPASLQRSSIHVRSGTSAGRRSVRCRSGGRGVRHAKRLPPPLRPMFAAAGQPPFPQPPFPQSPFPQQLLAVGHPLTVNAAREALNAAAQAAPSQSASASSPAGRQSAAYEETMSGLLSLLSQSHALLSDAPRSVARVIDLLQAQNSASSSTTPAQRNVYQREAHQLGLFLRRLGHGLSGVGRLLSQVAPQNPNNSAPLALAPSARGAAARAGGEADDAADAAGGGGDAQQQQWQQPQITFSCSRHRCSPLRCPWLVLRLPLPQRHLPHRRPLALSLLPAPQRRVPNASHARLPTAAAGLRATRGHETAAAAAAGLLSAPC